MATALLKRIFTAPVFEDEEKNHQTYLLHVILWGLICVPVPFVLYVLVFTPENSTRGLVQAGVGEVINFYLLFLLKRGYVQRAARIQVAAFWLFFTISAITGAGVSGEPYLLGYPLVIIIAGLLLGGRIALGVTVASLLTGLWMVYAENQGILNPSIMTTPLTTWILTLVLFPIGALLQYLSSHTVKNALSRARLSEEKYKLISRVSSDYTFESDVDKQGNARLVWVAGAFEKMTGYSPEEYIATGGWLAHLHPDDLEKDAKDMRTLLKNQDVIYSDVRTFAKNGEIRWERVFAHPIWNEEKNCLIGIVGAVQDVTQEKKAEEKIIETLLQQSAILNGIPDMAWLKDINGRYIAVNEQFIKAAGRKIEEIAGKTDFDIWPESYAEKYRNDDLEVMQTRQRKSIEELEIDNTGEEQWIETTRTPILNIGGELIGTTGIARRITERKRAGLEREKLITELESKNAELERFTYTVSHDLKSPLVTIIGFLGYLERDAQDGDFEKFNTDIGRIRQAVEKMQNLLKDLLEISRIGRLVNEPVETRFGDIVKDALTLVEGQAKAGQVGIQFVDDGHVVHGDRIRLVEVMQNLIDNAIKFMGNQPKPRIRIGAITDEQNKPTFFVQDNGIGIDPKYIERIFGLFNKLEANTSGSGVGLAIVKRVIEVHGGKIWVESKPNIGTTFYFKLS